MVRIGLLREGKIPLDNRVAITPSQCKWLMKQYSDLEIFAQPSSHRCFTDNEYERNGVTVQEDLSVCELLLGIKEVPVSTLIPGKTYLFFSHTKKKQPHNQQLFQALIQNKITLIDFECFEHEDGQRIIGFGFFAGVVGAHNGLMAFGNRTGSYRLDRVYKQKDFRSLIHTYFGLKLPNIKIAVCGSGRVAHGITEIMNLAGVIEVEKEAYLKRTFGYPVYVQLKGAGLYAHAVNGGYNRDHFHQHPQEYKCVFDQFVLQTDLLMNGVYWDQDVPRLFENEAIQRKDFRIQTIADVTDDRNGSIPINLGDQTIEHPVYGVDRDSFEKTAPYLPHSIDVMAVGNLPNELPRDASRYFGEQLIKYVLPELLTGGSAIIERATLVKYGELTEPYTYLREYAYGS